MMMDDFSIRLITYNVADQSPPDDLSELLNLKAPAMANIYAIGLQELDSTVKQMANDAVNNDPWTNAITNAMSARNYLRLKTIRLLGIHLSVYVRKPDLIYINNVETNYTRTGLGGYWGNKGGVSIRMDVCGVNVCIVNCHLTPHLPNVASRLAAYDQIIESQTFRDIPTILDHDYVFFMGDLNFRLDDIKKPEAEKILEKRDYPSLWKYDQLKKCMKEGLILVDFNEMDLDFPCTFKFNKKSSIYDTSKKQRKPAWTDRILWKAHQESFDGEELAVTPQFYTSLHSYCHSDHKPVIAEFNVKVMSAPPILPVMFEPLDVWVSTLPGGCWYSLSRDDYVPSIWDWIGLYKADYKHPHDYVTWKYVPTQKTNVDAGDGTDIFAFEMGPHLLQGCSGSYFLCYYSYYRDCVIGYSDMFKICLTDDSSSSDESMAIGRVGLDDDDGPANTTFVREDTSTSDENEYIDEAYVDERDMQRRTSQDWQLDPDESDGEEGEGNAERKSEGGVDDDEPDRSGEGNVESVERVERETGGEGAEEDKVEPGVSGEAMAETETVGEAKVVNVEPEKCEEAEVEPDIGRETHEPDTSGKAKVEPQAKLDL